MIRRSAFPEDPAASNGDGEIPNRDRIGVFIEQSEDCPRRSSTPGHMRFRQSRVRAVAVLENSNDPPSAAGAAAGCGQDVCMGRITKPDPLPAIGRRWRWRPPGKTADTISDTDSASDPRESGPTGWSMAESSAARVAELTIAGPLLDQRRGQRPATTPRSTKRWLRLR